MANKNQKCAYDHRVRAKWYFLVEKVGKTVDEVCDLYFISRKTYYKWRIKDLGSKKYQPKKNILKPRLKMKSRYSSVLRSRGLITAH